MAGRPAPLKPWERSSGGTGRNSTPLGPSTASDGQLKPWEQPAGSSALATPAGTSALTSSQPARPWERDGTSGASAPLTNASNYSSGYGSSMYGGSGYGYNSRPMYGRGYAGSSYGSGYGSSMYGSGAYGSGYGSSYGSGYGGYGSSYGGMGYGSSYGSGGYGGYGGYGGGGYGSQYGSPYSRPALGGPAGNFEPGQGPPQPPSAWQHMLMGLSSIVSFFGRLSFLVDENAHAIHFFISALLQLLDRAGSLYGEMARFVLRLMGYKGKPTKGQQTADSKPPQQHPAQPGMLQQSGYHSSSESQLSAPAAAPRREPGWDNVWRASDH